MKPTQQTEGSYPALRPSSNSIPLFTSDNEVQVAKTLATLISVQEATDGAGESRKFTITVTRDNGKWIIVITF